MTLFPAAKIPANRFVLTTWIDRGLVVAMLLASATALSLNVADPDLWGHVQYGRDAILHGLPTTTTYSYVAAGYPWINHEILAEYALALVSDNLGGPGLLIVKSLLGFIVVGGILWHAHRPGAGLIAALSLTLMVAITLGNHWSLRPQLASYVSFTLLLALLSYSFAGWEGRWQLPLSLSSNRDGQAEELPSLDYSLPRLKLLWLAPPLFMLWTNAHGGFLAGLCIFLAYLGVRSVEAICRKGREADGLVLRFGCMGLAAIAATFLNPYGTNFHRWLYDDLRVPRPEIVEWRAPELLDLQFLPFWLLLAVSLASLVLSRRSRDFAHVTILGLILWQALTHHRHIAFFAIACGWWLPVHWDSLLVRLGVCHPDSDESKQSPAKSAFSASLSPSMQVAFAVLLVGALGITSFRLSQRLKTLNVERDQYPVAAFEFIDRHELNGKMVCTFNWAQYALATFSPQAAGQPGILVQVDGRCRTSYSQAMLDAHFDFLLGQYDPKQRHRDPHSGPVDPERVLNAGDPDLVLISRTQEPSVEVMQRQEGRWVLLYQDSLAQLWGRGARYDDPHSRDYFPPSNRQISDAPQTGYAPWPATPKFAEKSDSL